MSDKKKRPKLKEIALGPLPVDAINATLDMELEAGEVVFSIPAQKHAKKRHPDDFEACLPYIAGVVSGPLYVGDDISGIPARSSLFPALRVWEAVCW